jgi:hypothetical protein
MVDLSELIKGIPSDYQSQIHEKMSAMPEAEQERFAKQIADAIASSPESQGTAEARAKEREAREARAPRAGDPAPDFELDSLDGKSRVRLSTLRGRPVGLIFGSYT